MKCLMSWSGGKDSALALYRCLNSPKFSIVGLVTTISSSTNRISMHGVALDVLKNQTDAIGLPLHVITLPEDCSIDAYESIMGVFMSNMKQDGIEGVVFGDIFLEDIRAYREKQMRGIGLIPIFPLWGLKSFDVANEFFSNHFKSIITCVDGELLDESFVGQNYTSAYIKKLPDGVDPCGENGEFHSFVFAGPIFQKELEVKVVNTIYREYPNPQGGNHKTFWFADIAISK